MNFARFTLVSLLGYPTYTASRSATAFGLTLSSNISPRQVSHWSNKQTFITGAASVRREGVFFRRSMSDSNHGGKEEDEELLFVDVGANLLDDMYRGMYHGKERHEADLDRVLQRAWDNRVDKLVVTAGTVEESRAALEMALQDPRTFSTVGIHPTRCNNVTSDDIKEMRDICIKGIMDGTVVALGELGLDYARTQFCSPELQKEGLKAQLDGLLDLNLPLFLHNRDTGMDLVNLLSEYNNTMSNNNNRIKGVVHSFDDTLEVAQAYMDLGFYVGINGCSLKTEDNLKVLKQLPLERIVLETDCPWCDIRPTHASHTHVTTTFPTKKDKQYQPDSCVKGRAEPCHIIQVAEVVAGVHGVPLAKVAQQTRLNAHNVFGGLQKKSKDAPTHS
uniref:TatD related DNase n=1 Tax=Attheya septentrionalis TaxID=420275 RepID=A0A7S2UJL2_9STRA|mmetsp:Transcript_28299/g.51577  ORF Transcript_28299/g.51577 Transcript_28299/m.51577 type:complete len:390 (+) Transcript_28299:385-1554(+)